MLLKSKVELDLCRIYRAWYRQIMKEVYTIQYRIIQRRGMYEAFGLRVSPDKEDNVASRVRSGIHQRIQ